MTLGSVPSERVDALGVTTFTAVAFGLAWLVSLPLWLDPRGLRHPAAPFLLPAMMFTPAAATAVVVFALRREGSVRRAMGLAFGLRTAWPYWLFAWLAIPAFCLAAPLVAQALGVVQLDLREFSGFREVLRAAGPAGEAALAVMPLPVLVAVQLVQGFVLAPVLNAPFAFGEEWGWRGYLLPKLLPLGQWPALLVSGFVWGAWHAPVILLGYNYPQHRTGGVVLMIALCLVLGVIFGWLRLATDSLWPAVIAHGALNSSANATALLARAGVPYDTAVAGITGWTGWILPVACIVLLVALRRLPVRTAEAAGAAARARAPSRE